MKAMNVGLDVQPRSHAPRQYAVAHWNANEGGARGAGHVAFVELVEDGGDTIWISEMNWKQAQLCHLSVRKITRSSDEEWPSHFIYIE